MTKWKAFERSCKYGVALYNFQRDGQEHLKLNVGDSVQITDEHDDWYRGYINRNRTKKGIFPKNFIHLKDASITRSGSYAALVSRESPIAQEITSVLREWHAIWRNLYVEKHQDFETVRDMMQELIDWRRKIMSRKLTAEELRDLQQKISARIDIGNAMLGLDLVVRDDQGNILDPFTTSTIELYRQHVQAADRIRTAQVNPSADDGSNINWPHTFNLYVMLRNFVCRIGEDADILMSLYDVKFGKFISENYLVKWSKEGVPKDIDMLNNFRVVFTDLGAKDRQREKVYLVFQIIRIGVMDPKDIDDKKQTRGLKRPFGVAAMEITEIIQGTKECNEDSQVFIPFQQIGEKEHMEGLIKKVVVAKEICHKGQGLWVSMKILSGDLKQAREDHPHLVAPNIAVARKMGFPDVILPGDVRNDIYVTLKQGEFNKGPAKTSDKNVECRMVVCNKKGEHLSNVISHGGGGDMLSEYKSLIYYHEDKPKWFETVKVAISTEEEFKGLHLKFFFKHKSTSETKDKNDKSFAMSFVKLMNKNGTTLSDTDHNLLVYKIEDKKGDKSAPYLDLPSTREDLEEQDIGKGNKVTLFSGPYTLSQKDSFTINTFVCSTKLTHNVDLLGLLRWQEILNDSTQLQQHLDKLMHVDGEEIVKFLQDLLDSLFSILMQNTISDMHDNQVFEALVYIIGLISDRKYQQFRPVLDAYVKTSFSFALAYQKLMVILKDYVDRAVEVNQKILKGSMKSLEYLFKFIVQSRTHFAMLNEGRGKQQFQQTLKQLIQAISGMMLYTSDNMLLAQGSALKYISTIISDVLTVFDAVELSELMKEFINNVPKERLTKQKLKCIEELVHSQLFTNPECRQILLPMILEQTKTLIDEKTRSLMDGNNEREKADKRDEELGDCINVLSDIMDVTFLKENGPHEEDISLIMKYSFRTVIQSAIQMDKASKIAGNCVSVLMGILRQMTETHYRQYIQEFPYSIDLRDFLMEILMLFQVLVSNPVYPSDWMDMIMLQNSIILRALRFFAQTVHDNFSEPFEEQLWSCFFHCSISFLTQRALQLEGFSQSKRNKVINRYKDMRRETGFEIRQMWFQLGIHKIYFIPSLVGPILEMTLIPETELRKATIPIFFDMMQCEFTQVDPVSRKIRANFHQVENELIIQLDALVEGGCGDEEYKQLMYDILYQLCCGHSTIKEQGIVFVEIIKTLLQRLLEYRNIIQNEIKEHRMSCIVNLLNYYHDIGRQEMYIRYLYKLCELHLECDNYTEAANTLLLHVNLLQWSDDNLPLMLQSSWYPDSHTHRELKEQLYYNIIQYYDKGKMWEKGIQLCKELVSLYEIELFDYERLSFVLKRQADLYSCIIKELRPDPEYFRVGYYGRGFPEFLQNIVFIYRGKEYERLSDFNARMQTLFPNAELLRTLSPPSEEIKESDKQYLQINAVTPVLELQERFKEKPVSDKILKYYTVNEVQKFTYSRRMNESESDIAKMWLERTYLTTSYPLPGILCWFPVITTELVRVSPLECAIETLESTNKKINSAVEQHALEQTISVQNLGMLLNGVVDASVNGGISNYKIFYADEYGESEEDMQLVIKLKELTRNQLLLLKEAMTIHKRKCAENMRPFHAHMEERFEEMCNLIKSEYNLKVPENSYMNTLKRFKSMSAVSLSRVSEAFVSITGASPEMNYATPVTRTSTPNRTPSVFVRAEKSPSSNSLISPSKGLQQKVSSNLQNIFNINLNKRASFATSEHSSDGSGGSNRNSLEHPIELSEQITPKRPPRPESSDQRRQSRPISSTQFRLDSNLNNSNSSLLSNHSSGFLENNSDSDIGEERVPPPLPEKPEKHHYADYSNLPEKETPPPTHTRLGHRKSKPVPPLPTENDSPEPSNPPPVPKKTHHSTSFSKTNNHK